VSRYGLTLLPVVLVLIIDHFLPQLQQNEAGKLVSARQVFDPTFLSRRNVTQFKAGDEV
jgi:hypothetical protein